MSTLEIRMTVLSRTRLRHARAGGNPARRPRRRWMPASAGMTRRRELGSTEFRYDTGHSPVM
ncbi:MAG: hypothetical protein WD069_02945, partial [Planctomycetales bacterium]